MTGRHLLVLTHRYSGLALAVVVLLIASTGVLTVFHVELDRLLNSRLLGPAETRGPARPLADLMATAKAEAGPAYRALAVDFPLDNRFPEDVAHPLSVYFEAVSPDAPDPYIYVHVDPQTGLVRGTRSSSLMGFLVELHIGSVAGRPGELVVGFTGLFLLLLVATGLIIWWPPAGKWRKAFQLKRGTRLKLALSLHNITGAVAASFLILSALSGLYLVFPAQVRGLLLLGPLDIETAAPPSVGPAIGPDAILLTARQLLPQARITMLELPTAHRPFYRIGLFQPGEARRDGQTSLDLSAADGRLLALRTPADLQARDRLLGLLRPIHTGEILGLPGRLLTLLAGLALMVVTVTGFLFWLWKPRKHVQPGARAI